MHAHAIHLHPIQWLGKHPFLLALIITSLITLFIAGVIGLMKSGIRFNLPDMGRDYPAMYPYGGF